MIKTCFLLLSVELLVGASAFAASEIKLSGRKDRVLSSEMRTTILDVAKECLYREDEGFVALSRGIENPYEFKEEEEEEAPGAPSIAVATKKAEAAAALVVYDDASVLKAVATSFAKKVRGTLARGSIHYLQLQGGGMLKSGTSFPVKIPQIKGKTFTVAISDVHSRGYTLTLGDATIAVPFDRSSLSSTSVTKDSAK